MPDMEDAKLIENLGGPGAVCDLLGIARKHGIQRVQNWLTRGIPARVRLERPDLFPMPKKEKKPQRVAA